MTRRGEAGYAVAMAVVAAGLFAYLSLLALQTNSGEAAMIGARTDRARLEAAADAGLAMALHGLGMEETSRRWAFDGGARQIHFDGALLTIIVEDERSKVPINGIDDAAMRRLLLGAGVQGRQLDALAACIQDWIDERGFSRTDGAKADAYRAAGADVLPRNGKIRTLEELLHVRGMTPQILADIAPSLTLFFGEPGTFNEKTATSLAIMTMLGSSEKVTEMRDLVKTVADGTRPAMENIATVSLMGRPLTVQVQAVFPNGSRVSHATVVQFTGNRRRPFWVRAYQ